MTTSIESLWYQRKITGYGANGSFPTEMTVVYTVGEQAYINNKPLEVIEIVDNTLHQSVFCIYLRDGKYITIPMEVNPEILYKTTENGDTTQANN